MIVNLTQEHLEEMRNIMIACDQYKKTNLSQRSYYIWQQWALKGADQIFENHFEVNGPKNTFAWLKDQIEHCPPVASTLLGQTVLAWCEYAAMGPTSYANYVKHNNYKKLFN